MRSFTIVPRGKNKQPADDFLMQMRDSYSSDPAEAPFVPCPDYSTDLRSLSAEQYSYYIHWRDQLRKGTVLKSDYGYEYIRICELINIPEERKHLREQLELLIDNTRSVKNSYSFFFKVYFDACIAFHLPLRGFGDFSDTMAVSSRASMLQSPVSFVDDPEAFCGMSSEDSGYCDDPEEMVALFNQSLSSIDSYLANTTGSGILDTYGGEAMSTQVEVFGGLFYEGDREYRLRYRDVSENSQMMAFLRAVYRCCASVICKANGRKGPAVPSILTKEVRAIIERNLHACEELPQSEKFLDSVPLSEVQEDGMLIIPDSKEQDSISGTFRSDIRDNYRLESDVRVQYAASGKVNAQYETMAPEQSAFYLYWRTQVRKGRYPTTDLGYVWLYLCELINSEDDPEDVYQSIVSLGEAYEKSVIREDRSFFSINYEHLIMRTALDYAVVKELPLPTDDQYPCNITINDSMHKLLNGADIVFSPEAVSFFSGANKTMKNSIDYDAAAIFSKALAAASNNSKSSDGATSYCGLIPKTVQIRVFETLKYYGFPEGFAGICAVDYYDYANSELFEGSCKELLKSVLRMTKAHRSGSKLPDDEINVFGSVFRGVRDIAQSYYCAPSAVPKKDRKLVLDKGMIESALDDLATTTRLMDTGEDSEKESIPEESDTEKMADEKIEQHKSLEEGWERLVRELDAEQVALLSMMLDDPGDPRVSGVRPKMIDSINDLAMDHVGDVLIESGKLVPDYEGELRKALAARTK